MLAGAGEDWDVLVVGYVSRFARHLRTAVNARHDLHARGAVILFADERVLSSDEDEWERWAREAVEAEAYSRRLAKRIREGYAAKRRRLGVPGGNRAPLGTVRDGRSIVVDEAALAIVRHAYELASAGLTDREVGLATGLAPTHVAEVLTNPFYADGCERARNVQRDRREKCRGDRGQPSQDRGGSRAAVSTGVVGVRAVVLLTWLASSSGPPDRTGERLALTPPGNAMDQALRGSLDNQAAHRLAPRGATDWPGGRPTSWPPGREDSSFPDMA